MERSSLRDIVGVILVSAGPNYEFKEQLKQAVPIEQYIGRSMELRREGSGFVGLCPFHVDKRPSFKINPARQSWVCWVCNLRGDIFDFVQRREGVDFRNALEILADHSGIPMPAYQKRAAAQKGTANDKQMLYKAAAWAEQQFHQFLLESEQSLIARNYLESRGITQDSIQRFRIGFVPDKYTWLMDRARKSEFSLDILEAAGLAQQGNHGWYDRFRGRVIFPIRDTVQRPIAFGGRVVPGLYAEGKEPPGKYYNSPETRLFSKSDTLYGLNMIDDELRRSRSLVIVEGYTDVIAAWQAGLRNVAAVLGTALNERHIRLIKRFADQITLVLDGDTAGQKRANEILDLFVAQDVDLRIMSLPDGSDPFDFLMTQGAEPFQKRVDTAPDALEHKIRVETKSIDVINDIQRSHEALTRILNTLAAGSTSIIDGDAKSQLRRERFLTRLSRKFNVDLPKIRERIREMRVTNQTKYKSKFDEPEPQNQVISTEQFDKKELELISLACTDPALLDLAIESVSPGQFHQGPIKEIYELMVDCFHQGQNVTFDSLLLVCEDSSLKNILYILLDEHDQKQQALRTQSDEAIQEREQMDQIIRAFNDLAVEQGNRALINQMQQGQLDDKEEASKFEELLRQARQRQGL